MKPNRFPCFAYLMGAILAVLMFTGCTSSRDFDYKGQEYDTVQSMSIDNRKPFPVSRDTWRLGPTNDQVIAGEEVSLGASEDGKTIIFRVAFYAFGSKSQWNLKATERSTKVMDKIVSDLQKAGYPIIRRVAIIDRANPLGYNFGGPSRVIGFYLFSNKEGAYDALLETLAARPESEKIADWDKPEVEAPVAEENLAAEAPDHEGAAEEANDPAEAMEADQEEESFWDVF
ncbi:MAG: hypothetical protein ACQKBV_02290 [Puniceicoccales bacterium]